MILAVNTNLNEKTKAMIERTDYNTVFISALDDGVIVNNKYIFGSLKAALEWLAIFAPTLLLDSDQDNVKLANSIKDVTGVLVC